MTYKHLLMALGLVPLVLILRLLNLASALNGLASLTMVLVPGAVAAWTFMLGHTQTTRWRLRHSLADEVTDEVLDHLDRGLGFLVQNARMVVLETNEDGLFLEVPGAFAGYAERLIPSVLPGARLARHEPGRMARQ